MSDSGTSYIEMVEIEKKKKGIALKASSFIQEESDKEDLNEIEEEDDFSSS